MGLEPPPKLVRFLLEEKGIKLIIFWLPCGMGLAWVCSKRLVRRKVRLTFFHAQNRKFFALPRLSLMQPFFVLQCKCSGEMPCSRCRRSGVRCTYSTKRKLGRPRGLAAAAKLQAAQQACEAKKGRKEGNSGESGALTHRFSATPVTGLGGLAESRFLSCFLEHFTPM